MSAFLLRWGSSPVLSGATNVFNITSFGGGSNVGTVASATIASGQLQLVPSTGVQHKAGSGWYNSKQNITAFHTRFTFQLVNAVTVPKICGMTLCFQNGNQPGFFTSPFQASADSNNAGYGCYDPNIVASQANINNSVAIKFDINNAAQYNYAGSTGPLSHIGCYINGGTYSGSGGLIPDNDVSVSNVNFANNNVFTADVVYDGSILVLVVGDNTTGAQHRYAWPVDIPTAVGSTQAVVGFTAGQVDVIGVNVNTWSWDSGYNPRLAMPSAGITAGQYTTTQSVPLSGPAGASIYYTQNGLDPTTSDSLYSGTPISVSTDQLLKYVAVQSGSTDSFVGSANYQIRGSATPTINFPSGFASSAGLINLTGRSVLSSGAIQLTDGTNPPSWAEVGNAWYVAPVAVNGSWSTTFQMNLAGGNARGFNFILQNQPPASRDGSIYAVTGGPTAVGRGEGGAGGGFSSNPPGGGVTGGLAQAQWCGLLESVGVYLGPIAGSGSYMGVLTDGALATTSNCQDMTTGGVNCQSGHNFNVTVAYNGSGTLTVTCTDATNSGLTFSHSFSVNVPTAVGANTAFVGFGASDYGGGAQKVNSWTGF